MELQYDAPVSKEFAQCFFFFSSRRRHTRFDCDWSSDVCSSDLQVIENTLIILLLGVLSVHTGSEAYFLLLVMRYASVVFITTPRPRVTPSHACGEDRKSVV